MENSKTPEKIIVVNTAKTVFNPYVKDNHMEIGARSAEFKAIGVIKGASFWTDNEIHNSSQKNIYIYKISYNYAGFWMGNWNANLFISNREADIIQPALAFFDEAVMDYIELSSSNEAIPTATIKDTKRVPFYIHSLGKISNKDASTGEALKTWKTIPRELFDGGRKYVYLFICTRRSTAPQLKGYAFPNDRAFFWELPTASSIYDNEYVNKSVIVGGMVKEARRFSIARKTEKARLEAINLPDNALLLPNFQEVKGSFSWKKGGKPVKLDSGCVFRQANPSDDDYEMIFTRKDNCEQLGCGDIRVNVYSRASCSASNRFNVLMWRSGSNDDSIRDDYLEADYQNKYPYILRSMSLGAIYGSLADIRVISPECAGSYLARHLAVMPKDNRSLSIEGAIENLFGGPLYRVEEIVTDGNIKAIAEIKSNDPDYESSRDLKAYYKQYVDELFAINDNHLFYDLPVKLEMMDGNIAAKQDPLNARADARYYVETALGISRGSSGCEEAGNILTGIFKRIKKLKVPVDYVTSDMELIHCDARRLATRRFNGAYIALNNYANYEKFRKDVYGGKIWNDLAKNSHVRDQLFSKGYFFAGEIERDVPGKLSTSTYYPLSEIATLPLGADKDTSIYAKSYSKDYELRRNIGVWDTVMNSYENDLFSRFIFRPLLSSFKNARCGVYARGNSLGWINYSTQFENYLGGNTEMDDQLSSTVVLYGGTGTTGFQRTSMDTWTMYPNKTSILKMLIESVNSLRSSMAARPDNTQVYIASAHFLENDALMGSELMKQLEQACSNTSEAIDMIYRELMYHIFLHNPEKVYAYFKHPATMLSGIEEFYTRNSTVLNDILTDLHGKFGNSKTTLLTRTLALVTEPYLLSGAKVGSKNLWRLTFDAWGNGVKRRIRKLSNGLSVTVGDKTIVFPKGKILMGTEQTQYDPGCGYWIETPNNMLPMVQSGAGYYINNPAYRMKCETPGIYPDEIGQGNPMGYKYFNTYTMFGEKHNRLVCSLKFKMTEKIENYAYLLWNGVFADNDVKSQYAFRAVIGETKQNNPLSDTVPFYYMYKSQKFTDATCELEVGRSYEIKLTETIDSESKTMRVAYELWRQNDSGSMEHVQNADKDKVFGFHTSDANNHELLAPNMLYTFLGDASTSTMEDRFVIEDFKIYFDDHYEKIEIFRERDGVNVGRVNEKINGYAIHNTNKNFRCQPGERFIAKFTYLNATDSPQVYKVQYWQDEKQCKLGRNNLFPADSTVVDPVAFLKSLNTRPTSTAGKTFDETGVFIVAPNSEGYVLIDLPDTPLKTEKVTLRLQSLGAPTLGLSDWDGKLKELERILKIRRTTEVSVDIQRE